jgi:FAD/FMN-containing dehydrogenase
MNEVLENELRGAYPDGLTWQKTIPTFHPESCDQIVDIFHLAAKRGQRLFISGFSNNIDPVGDAFADLLVIKSDRLNSVVNVADGDFYITVGAGYPLREINQALAEHNLWFPFGETDFSGSAGGALASGLAGNDGHHIVPLSRFLISLTAVLPDGSLVTPGAVTFKSVSGYDISRIFYNSWGTLGMVGELTFRVLPMSKKAEWPHLALFPPDHNAFIEELNGDSPLAELCRKIKKEFDPAELLPIL